ncbi:hypothetical protein [Francisella philomiragia]|uniref:hypothetical protein n=1 Tax=Francisella philomiragia TaxID=28110 RepID=UPI001903A25C|nr:hypothetical protein [Francisella philomiragia]MBK2270199.1 hypothetical protein [Francisella philomiragia]MBK2275863.1 hypothetical protein [Francisella philomiragia]MBK2305076.1 hypothetical protein [Francisella philomiragia]
MDQIPIYIKVIDAILAMLFFYGLFFIFPNVGNFLKKRWKDKFKKEDKNKFKKRSKTFLIVFIVSLPCFMVSTIIALKYSLFVYGFVLGFIAVCSWILYMYYSLKSE